MLNVFIAIIYYCIKH